MSSVKSDSSSSRSPNPLKFYDRDSKTDTWKICFFNNAGIPLAKLCAFFSRYGEVVKVDQVRELCFVHFRTEEDAKICALATRGHSSVRLRPFYPKSNCSKSNEESNSETLGDTDNSRKDSSGSIGDTTQSPVLQLKSPEINVFQPRVAAANCPPTLNHQDPTQKASAEPIQTGNPPLPPAQRPVRQVSMKSPEIEVIQAKVAATNCPPTLNHHDTTEKVVQGNYPMSFGHLPVPRKIYLQDVVVANIPEAYGSKFILEMLEDFRPVCASQVEVVPRYSLRYCLVYFETEALAKEVESVYDNADLAGNKLVVQRPQSLALNADKLC